jgi:hypothetical protein
LSLEELLFRSIWRRCVGKSAQYYKCVKESDVRFSCIRVDWIVDFGAIHDTPAWPNPLI